MKTAHFLMLGVIFLNGAVTVAQDSRPVNMYSAPYTLATPTQSIQANGMDFWQDDRLIVPQSPDCRNLLNNPSFEVNLRYYTFPCDIGSYIEGYADKYTIDTTSSHSGERSLKIKGIAPPYPFDMLQSFAYAVKKSTVYTLSFYAKTNHPGIMLGVKHMAAHRAKEQQPEVSNSKFKLTADWQRYSIRIKSNSSGYAFGLSCNDNIPGAALWIDDIQLEEAASPGEFTQKPSEVELVTAAKDNFLSPGQNIDGKLRIKTVLPQQRGTVAVSVTDFFYQTVELGNYPFVTDTTGNAIVAIPLERYFNGKKGVFVIRTDIRLPDSANPETEFLRFSIMDRLDGTQRNKNIVSYHQLVIPNYEQAMQRWQDIGIGSTNYFYYNFNNPLLFDIIKKHHIEDTTASLRQHWDITLPSGEKVLRNNAISIQPGGAADNNAKVLVSGWRTWDTVTPDQEKAFEQAAEEFARYYHWRKNFSLDHEMYNKMLDNGNFEDFAKILIACAKGVKKADPQNQAYLEGGAANVMGGIALTQNLLAASQKIDPEFRFDRFAVHAYGHPENEEFDDLLTRFLQVLDHYGYQNAPLYVNEGGYYSPYCIAEWGLTPYRPFLMDHYQLWSISYDMGWGERISAALTVRAWLLALKHQDRIKQFNVWRPFIYQDAELTPMAVQKGANTLMRLLGNASFREEVVFTAKSKTYLFETDDKIPIAALWTFENDIEYGKNPPMIMSVTADKAKYKVVDFMENEIISPPESGNFKLGLSPFPVFIIGEKGKFPELTNMVKSITMDTPEKYPPIHISGQLLTQNKMQLELKNLLTRDFHGSLEVIFNDQKITRQIDIDSLGKEMLELTLPTDSQTGSVGNYPIDCTITADNPQRQYQQSFLLNNFAVAQTNRTITMDGNLGQWQKFPWLKLTSRAGKNPNNKQFEARFKSAWDKDNFYLLVEVTDNKLFYGAPVRNTAQATSCDTLIVYFDTLCNGKDKNTMRVDSDDYYYAFLPRPEENKALVYVQEACNQQLSLGVNSVQAKTYAPLIQTNFQKTDTGYRYLIAFPQNAVLPLQLKIGSTFGFGLMVWDQDGERDEARQLNFAYPDGNRCWRQANFWPQAVLIR